MIVLQLVVYCLLFTVMVRYAVRGGVIDGLYFYPKAVQDRAIEIGLTDRETMIRNRTSIADYTKQMNGFIHLIRGNHDKRSEAYENCFHEVAD